MGFALGFAFLPFLSNFFGLLKLQLSFVLLILVFLDFFPVPSSFLFLAWNLVFFVGLLETLGLQIS